MLFFFTTWKGQFLLPTLAGPVQCPQTWKPHQPGPSTAFTQRPGHPQVSPASQTPASLKTKHLHAQEIRPNLTHFKVKSEEVNRAKRYHPLFYKATHYKSALHGEPCQRILE